MKNKEKNQAHEELALRQNAFCSRVVNMWNSLPASMVSAKKINQFKNGLDEELAKKYDKFTYGIGYSWQASAV